MSATTPSADAARPVPVAGPSGPSMATVVWGLVLLAIAALAGVSEWTSLDLDPTLVLPAVLLGAGLLLVVSAGAAVVRRPRRTTADPDPVEQPDQQLGATRPSDPV
jgi:hypothetical protein